MSFSCRIHHPHPILKYLDAVTLVGRVSPAGLVIIIFQSPESAPKIETKGNRLTDIWLSHECLDLKPIHHLHFCNGFIGLEKRWHYWWGLPTIVQSNRLTKGYYLRDFFSWQRNLFFGSHVGNKIENLFIL